MLLDGSIGSRARYLSPSPAWSRREGETFVAGALKECPPCLGNLRRPLPAGALRGDRIQHRPQQLALERQRAHRFLLERARVAPGQGELQTLLGIHARLRHAAAEIIEAPRLDPGVMLLKRREP